MNLQWKTLPRYLMPGLVALAVLGFDGACGASPTPAPAPAASVSFKSDVQPVFTANCVGCHQGASAPAGLSLEPGAAYKNLANVAATQSSLKRVTPGDPDQSYIIHKLQGTQAQVGSGAQMPFGRSPLPQAQIDLLKRWISSGAPDN